MKKKKSSSNTVLNTTVMTDVLFILLTFFVLVSTVKKDAIQVQAAKVDKQPNPQEMQKKTEQYVLTIDQKNQIYLNGKPVENPEALQAALNTIKEKSGTEVIPAILLRPDAGSNSSKLIEIFAALNKVGLTENVQIEVESK